MAGVLDIVGNTPLVELQRLNPNPAVRIFAKLEGNNPGGSVKDRPALNMIRSALERGEIGKDTRLIEATSGNTGIAMALMAKLFNLQIELVMPSTSTRERVLTMEAFGAKVRKERAANTSCSTSLPTPTTTWPTTKPRVRRSGETPKVPLPTL